MRAKTRAPSSSSSSLFDNNPMRNSVGLYWRTNWTMTEIPRSFLTDQENQDHYRHRPPPSSSSPKVKQQFDDKGFSSIHPTCWEYFISGREPERQAHETPVNPHARQDSTTRACGDLEGWMDRIPKHCTRATPNFLRNLQRYMNTLLRLLARHETTS